MPNHTPRFATITWEEGDIPVATAFGDPYFAREDGRAETRHVFLAANGLPQRWQARESFTIGELGFGTGLNFLETVQAWLEAPGECRDLTFVSFEMSPMTSDDMARSLRRWPELSDLRDQLLADWPPKEDCPVHRATIAGAKLEIVLGDANRTLPSCNRTSDAWYLDGFNPAANPDLWGESLLAHVFARTAPEGTFATYTAAGWVRRNLAGAGFIVEKIPGFGRKRESIRGVRPGDDKRQTHLQSQ